MAGNFHESYTARDTVEPPKPRATGLVFAGVAVIIAVLFRDTPTVVWSAGIAAVALAGAAWLIPDRLGPLNIIWFRFGLLLHRIMSPVIMFVLFALLITPYGLAMQLFRDPLRRSARAQKRREAGPRSYWVDRTGDPPIDMTAQF
ncbi:MAG: hypothetical protein AAGG99_03880 [Pseudomonadota bacterium]